LVFLIGLLIALDIFTDSKTAGMFLLFDLSKKLTGQNQISISRGKDEKEIVSLIEDLKGASLRRDFIGFLAFRSMLQVS
jgi:hypothetical protein